MKNSAHLIKPIVGGGTVRRLCTESMETVPKPKPKPKPVSLYRRLSPLKASGDSVTKTVNQYLREGKTVSKYEVEKCVRQLRKYKRFQHALELIGWMEKRGINLSHSDYAVRIDLISKARSISAAEAYFNNLPFAAKNKLTYGALLNCYCKEKMTEKAVALFEKMNELGYASTPLAYNNLIALSMRIGKPEKVPILVQEMKDKDIPLQAFTYNVLMKSYSTLKDIDAVERVMEEMRTKDYEKCEWTTYSNLAAIYIEAGLFEKAELSLKGLEEKLKNTHGDSYAYHFLISLYAGTSNLTEVYRVWDVLKAAHPNINNLSYLCMLQALSKLDDFDGLQKCFKEWESGCSQHDMKLTNIIISAYLRRDMFEEAKQLCEDAVQKGYGPSLRTHELFMDFFLKSRQAALAMKCIEAAISKAHEREWKPKEEKVRAIFKQLEEEKDVTTAEKFYIMLKKFDCLDSEAYCSLLSVYIAAGKTEPEMRERIKEDKIEITSEIQELLEKVCPK